MNKPLVLKLYQIYYKNYSLLNSNDYEPRPYGNGNPYNYCVKCERSMIEVTYLGHHEGCEYLILKNKVKSLDGQMKVALNTFLELREYENIKFKNYIWFKKDKHVDGLKLLLKCIENHKIGVPTNMKW